MPVEVAANAVVVLSGLGCGYRARMWALRSGAPVSRATVIAACRCECRLILMVTGQSCSLSRS